MDLSVILVLCACVPVSLEMATLTAHKRHHGDKIIYPDEYLNHLGYMENSHGYWLHTREERKKSINLYQVRNGLKPSGKIDKKTWKLMTTPRCGVPDLGKGALQLPLPVTSQKLNGQRRRRKRDVHDKAVTLADPNYSKWLLKYVTWRPGRMSNKLPIGQQSHIFNQAFQRWSQPSRMKISKTHNKPDIAINFARREHGDGTGNAFDGRGMLLAHAFGPGNADISGDIHFDADEIWTYGINNTKTRDLMMIAMHEVGHSLGLPHSNKTRDVMYPSYLKYNPDPQLSRGDIRQLRKLYGKDRRFKMPPRQKRKRDYIIQKNLPHWCRLAFNDVIRGPGKESYILSRKQIYALDDSGILPGYPKYVRQSFPNSPINTKAAVYVREKKQTFFFKGDRVWRYTNKSLDVGYPMPTKDRFPEKVQFGMAMMDRYGISIVYLFGKTLTWRWNQFTETVNGRYYPISRYWSGLPRYLDAAVEWHDGYYYFFSRAKYYKVSRYRKVVMAGYPKFKASAWLGGQCGNSPK